MRTGALPEGRVLRCAPRDADGASSLQGAGTVAALRRVAGTRGWGPDDVRPASCCARRRSAEFSSSSVFFSTGGGEPSTALIAVLRHHFAWVTPYDPEHRLGRGSPAETTDDVVAEVDGVRPGVRVLETS